jgi:hypothetical protein
MPSTKETTATKWISAKVPKLEKPDRQPNIYLSDRPKLIVTRNGITHAYAISSQVAAELIAAGFTHEA